jgi:hypothetical protein
MWFMIKALQVDFQFLKGEIQRYPQSKRKYQWAAGLALPACIGVGGIIGASIGGLSVSVKGDAIGAGVAYAFIVPVVLFAGRPANTEGR